jgi:hypothetical protein
MSTKRIEAELKVNRVLYQTESDDKASVIGCCFRVPIFVPFRGVVEVNGQELHVTSINLSCGFLNLKDVIKFVIPRNVDFIGYSSFSRYESLREVIFESDCNLKRIEKDAFRYSKLKSIRIPSKVEFIGEECFAHGSMIEVVFEGDCNLKQIEKRAFRYSKLKSIRIPSKVEFIGELCFECCKCLGEIRFEKNSSLKKIGCFAFLDSGLKSIELPDNCEVLDGALVGLKSVSISSLNPFFVVEEGYVFSTDRRKLIYYFGRFSKVVICRSIESIGLSCFYWLKSLHEIQFDSDCHLGQIDEWTFGHSGLKSIRIPSNVEFIGESCFYKCKSLNEIVFESDCKLKTIDESAFAFSGITSIQIPSNVEFIGKSCFYACKFLNEIVFESNCNLTRINESTFERSGPELLE